MSNSAAALRMCPAVSIFAQLSLEDMFEPYLPRPTFFKDALSTLKVVP